MTDFDHDDLLKRLDSLNQDVPPLPEDFHAGWVGRLEDNMEKSAKKPVKTILNRALAAAAALVFVIGGTLLAQRAEEQTADQAAGAGATRSAKSVNYSNDAVAMDMAPLYGATFEDAEYESDYGVAGQTFSMAEAPASQMLIRTASLTIGTQRYDESLNALVSLCESTGGWISYASESLSSDGLRTSNLTLRIPVEQLDDFLTGASGLGRITRRSETAEDVTESYHDTRARLGTQQALMARLQALVTDAASLADLLELESQIADTQYQIDRLQSSLNSTERQVNFSTVDVALREEKAAADITNSEKSLGERLLSALQSGGEAFLRLLEDGVVFLAAALPFIAIVAVVWGVVALIRRGIRRRKSPQRD